MERLIRILEDIQPEADFSLFKENIRQVGK